MKKQLYVISKSLVFFIRNNRAVLGLPMRLTVILIIGVVALIAILAFILNPCLFPEKLVVVVNPTVNTINTGDEATFDLDVHVSDSEGNPVKSANVIIDGLGGAGSGRTDKYGDTTVQIMVRLDPGRIQGFLNVKVNAGACYERFSQLDMIAVVRS